MTRVLALDWGEKRVGVAFSQGILASPHSVIQRTTNAADYARVLQLVEQTGAELLVLGLPLSFNPEEPIGPQARRILKHKRGLEKVLPIPIKMVDETYTTVKAEEFLREANKKGKIPVDAAAAAVILQSYLGQQT